MRELINPEFLECDALWVNNELKNIKFRQRVDN